MRGNHVSKRPKGVVPERVYGRGTVVLLCVITAFHRPEKRRTYAKSRWHADMDNNALTCACRSTGGICVCVLEGGGGRGKRVRQKCYKIKNLTTLKESNGTKAASQ